MTVRLRKDSELRSIIEQLASAHDLPAPLVKVVLADALRLIRQRAHDLGRLQLRGFGVLRKQRFAQKVARNPRTGQAVVVPARSRLVFVEEATREPQ